MLRDLTAGTQVYLVTGYTDLRRSIDGLAEIVQGQLHLDPFSKALFLFCGRRRDRIKGLLWEGDGFLLLYKRLDNGNSARIKKNQSKETDIDLHGIIKKEKKNILDKFVCLFLIQTVWNQYKLNLFSLQQIFVEHEL